MIGDTIILEDKEELDWTLSKLVGEVHEITQNYSTSDIIKLRTPIDFLKQVQKLGKNLPDGKYILKTNLEVNSMNETSIIVLLHQIS